MAVLLFDLLWGKPRKAKKQLYGECRTASNIQKPFKHNEKKQKHKQKNFVDNASKKEMRGKKQNNNV